ncbi:alpha/beta hydrolase fold domain-containing protein [Cupriavidus basilensis]|uniref:alpha/beta hydrolase fold domain-containing protein n=1 Tax=Cupriavidus basilensis TaxID=68895 RepID=UPI0039F65722
MPSIQCRLWRLALRLVRRKQRFSSAQALHEEIRRRRKIGRANPTARLLARHAVSMEPVAGVEVYTVRPRGNDSGRQILYLHGGGYVFDIVSQHWDFIGKLVDALGATVTVPIYPLAPEHTHREVFAGLLPLYDQLVRGNPPASLTVMGDSAGGGMALALTQVARDTGRALPGRLVLLSPFLDATGSNPAIDVLEPLDPMLSKLGGIECGRVYAGGDPVTLAQVSPIYGSLRGLPPVTLFIGTHDVLLPDCRAYRALAQEQGLPLRYYEYEGMFHVWMLLPMPESNAAFAQIVAAVEADEAPQRPPEARAGQGAATGYQPM